MFDAGPAVRDLGEVVLAELLFLQAERTVVGRNRLKGIPRQALPQLLLVPFFTERGRKDIPGAFKPRRLHLREGRRRALRGPARAPRDKTDARYSLGLRRFLIARWLARSLRLPRSWA